MIHYRFVLGLLVGFTCCSALADVERLADQAFRPRQNEGLRNVAARRLRQGPNSGTWVDVERWCIAHARLSLNEDPVAVEEANLYLANVEWVSLWRGLVADTGIQVTDLLRTWFEFHDRSRLSEAARRHLLKLFEEWETPNRDRNRFAEREYAWPAEYTENHSLNILTAAYLIDSLLERDREFRHRLLKRFLTDRTRMGWSEFYSPNYAIFTAKPLSLLADFAPDPDIQQTAKMLLDLLVVDFSTHSLRFWRGMPFARGAAGGINNQRNSMVELIRHWYGDSDPNARYTGGTALVHLLTSRYRPPAMAQRLMERPDQRGHYIIRQTATHGPGRLRIPITAAITPSITMSGASGSGSYYDGHYWSISFASDPTHVITGPRGQGRHLLQLDRVLVVEGPVERHGTPTRTTLPTPLEQHETMDVYPLGKDRVIHLSFPDRMHIFIIEHDLPEDKLSDRVLALDPVWEEGVMRWNDPDSGQRVSMVSQRKGRGWILDHVMIGDALHRLDHGYLHDSPYLRSKRGSGEFFLRDGREGWRYSFHAEAAPQIQAIASDPFASLPPDWIDGPLGMRFMRIPSGEYPAGARADEGRTSDMPFQWLSTDAYYLAETEVTVAQFRAYLEEHPEANRLPDWYFKEWGKTDQHPQTYISWEEAQRFCEWMSKRYPGSFRLPTQIEWEKAARGWQYRVYPWGDTYDGSQSGTPNGEYAPVGQQADDRSPFGLLDMAGNAWEWCADTFPHPDGEDWRVLRGCGWNYDPDTFRIAYRSGWKINGRSPHIGFRILYQPPPERP